MAARSGSDIRFDQISKAFGHVQALQPLSLLVPDGQFLALLGPSGCGKTTALRILAGLEEPSGGRLFLGDREITNLQTRDRDVAMVFQNYALYPHMTVRENVAYPLRIRRLAKADRAAQVERVAEALEISELLDRRPRQLSGGQRQRVALARAIIRQPAAFLMDEPLSNLDAQLRTQMRTEIKHLQRQLGTTTLYVTHDQVEAMSMADSVAVMRAGVLQQLASPTELYEHPANRFVATFIGNPPMNILSGAIQDGSFRRPEGRVPVENALGATDEVLLGFRPEAATLMEDDQSGIGFSGVVYVVEPLGNETILTVQIGEALVNIRAPSGVAPAMGTRCSVRLDARRLHLFDPGSGVSLSNNSPKEESRGRDAS